jgi:hypothetical protein
MSIAGEVVFKSFFCGWRLMLTIFNQEATHDITAHQPRDQVSYERARHRT